MVWIILIGALMLCVVAMAIITWNDDGRRWK